MPFVYILANTRAERPVLYTGVTRDLTKRITEHRRSPRGFAGRYHCDSVVFFEETSHMVGAIRREKQIKGWLRAKKIALIEATNPDWRDLIPRPDP